MTRFLFTILISLVLLSFVSFCAQRVTQEQLKAQAQQFEKEENFEQAVKIYEKLVMQYPKGKFSDEALYKLGILYSNNLKNFQKSVEAYIKLVENYPKSNYAAQAQ
ncbi:MAG: tetratricopeptide repeat protein, partial [candidate division KSB1 bacterium]|nr:tetratricopeptide repeat protein [candidate division KSB1 bacterium]